MRTASSGVHPRSVGLAVVAALAAVWLVFGDVAGAHSGLAAASPGPDATVGGRVEVIELFYGDIILDFDAEVTGPDGETITGESVMLSEINAEFRLDEPLAAPGDYEVRHTILSFDDDIVTTTYTFTYDPGAAPALLVFIEETDESGLPWWGWVIIAAGALVVVVLAVRLLLAIRRS